MSGMSYEPIHGQGHRNVRKWPISKAISTYMHVINRLTVIYDTQYFDIHPCSASRNLQT